MNPPVPSRPVAEGELLWTPSAEFAHDSHLGQFTRWLEERHDLRFADYAALWTWSVEEPAAFWGAIWEYFSIVTAAAPSAVLAGEMPRTRWFPGSRINFAEHLLRYERRAAPDEVAIVHASERHAPASLTWSELGASVRALATWMRAIGIVPGDRVVSYLPTIPQTVIALIATTAIGAIWSSAAPEFGARTVLDRFAQIEPKLLFAADGYRFGGKDFDRTPEVEAIVAGLPSLERLVWLPYLDPAAPGPFAHVPVTGWEETLATAGPSAEAFAYERVAEDHPLWILYSSGTTGLPKAIVHGHVGITLEQFKTTAFNMNLKPSSRTFFYTTTGWMMFNALVAALLQGASIVLYDGHPAFPAPDRLWQLAASAGVTLFGASPTYVQQMQKAGLVPKDRYDLSGLETIFLAGSPASPETFAWFYENVKADLWVTSQSGGTDFCSGLVGSVATQPVYAGEIQGRVLGMDVHAWDDAGNELTDAVGELVVTSPCPSMPLFFWNDPGDVRYREAYFSTYPGVWRHGDFIKLNRRGGAYVYGRSDSTLNRFGVRIGSAEIYRCLAGLDEIDDSLIVCIETPGGGFFMPLFVKLAAGTVLDDLLEAAIVGRLRADCSPRHVPDEIHAVPDIPYTLSAKKMEVPVRRILQGAAAGVVAAPDAMRNPGAIDWFVAFRAANAARIGV
ncbi:MAG: acetoacetate--CoA ligase [Candidatus Velthaea sp.]